MNRRIANLFAGATVLAAFGWIGPTARAEPSSKPAVATENAAVTSSPVDPLRPWKKEVKVSPVSAGKYHSIHSYYVTSPESPDGSWVLFYASMTAEGHDGEIRIRERATGKETVLARDVSTEDAHRAACQQWVSGGQRVVFHNVIGGHEWVVVAVDLKTGEARTLAKGWQVGFGQPSHDIVPLYGPHWNPGERRDLSLLNVETGKIEKTSLTADGVRMAYAHWVSKMFGDKPISIFFPVLSPDMSRVMFKLATSTGDDFRSKSASYREGLFCYDLGNEKFTAMRPSWGHPAWNPNSREILNIRGTVLDSNTGILSEIPNYPRLRGDQHPSYSPDGGLFVSDTAADNELFGAPKGHYAVVVGDVRTGKFVTLRTFDNSQGAQSWRRSHPHPVFSPDGKRIYFNVSDEKWTRLYVAEAR